MPTYFNQKSQTWYCKFYYRDYRGRSCQKKKGGFKLQREAQEWERSFIRRHEGRPDMTFADLYTLYAEDMGHRLRYSTMIAKDHLVRTKILPFFGEMPINQIEAPAIRKWQNEMGAFRMKGQKGYSQTYLRSMNNQLSAILNYAVRYYGLPSNPCHKAGAMGRKNASRKQFWNFSEFMAFIRYFDEDSQFHLIFSLLYYTGIRIGELMALTCDDFSENQCLISINKSYHRINSQDVILPPKTLKSDRIVTLPQFLGEKMARYLRKESWKKPSDRIFSYSKYYITKSMTAACLATGVKKIRIHDLRHSHASLLIEMGCSPLLIAERLGHENIETTLNTYSHLYPNKQKKLAEELNVLHYNKSTESLK